VSRGGDDLEGNPTRGDRIAFPDGNIGGRGRFGPEHAQIQGGRGNEHVRVRLVDDDLGAGALLHIPVAGYVVHVSVGVDDIFYRQAVIRRQGGDPGRIRGGIDHQGLAGFLVAHQIGEDGHLTDLHLF